MRGGNCTHDVAILAPFATELYVDGERFAAGGAEMQSYYLAHSLAERGLRVAHIVHADPRLPVSDGRVAICQLTYPNRTIKGTRLALAYWRALGHVHARVIVQRSLGLETAIVGTYCRATGRAFVYSASSNVDATAGTVPSRLQSRLALRGIARADAVVVQTHTQRELISEHLGRSSTVIPSFAPAWVGGAEPEAFLWVGRVLTGKGPIEYLNLAERVPEARFRMVATPSHEDPELMHVVTDKVASLRNVDLLGPRNRDEIFDLFKSAVAIVSTSRPGYEGFPNTFLEAWSFGVPALTLNFDPDGVIDTHGLGSVAGGSLDRLAEVARSYWHERSSDLDVAHIKRYLLEHHSTESVGGRWAELVDGFLDASGPSGPRRTHLAAGSDS